MPNKHVQHTPYVQVHPHRLVKFAPAQKSNRCTGQQTRDDQRRSTDTHTACHARAARPWRAGSRQQPPPQLTLNWVAMPKGRQQAQCQARALSPAATASGCTQHHTVAHTAHNRCRRLPPLSCGFAPAMERRVSQPTTPAAKPTSGRLLLC